MAYNSYYPATYQPVYQYQQQPVQQFQQPQQQGNSINWIQGIESAKAYPIAPNASVILMDSESPHFYIKSADQSGMPTLRVFKFEEVTAQQQQAPQVESTPKIDTSIYVTRDEFEKRIAELTTPRRNNQQRKESKDNA